MPRFRLSFAPRRINRSVIRAGFTLLAVLGDFGAIALTIALLCPVGPELHAAANGSQSRLPLVLAASIFFVAANIMRNEYEFTRYLVYKDRIQNVFLPWNIVFISALGMTFIMQAGIGLSAFETIGFYAIGLLAIIAVRMMLVALARGRAEAGSVAARRVLLVGYEDEIADFSERYEPWRLGMRIISASVLRGAEYLKEDLQLANASARILRPDDIFILLPWSHKQTIDACLNSFLRVPASIHLGPEHVLDRFADAKVSKIGPIACLNLVDSPLSATEVFLKRMLDITLAASALVMLSPLLLAVAMIIKYDSPGPVIFRQRRYGFNREPFRIFKFRSMTAIEDNAQLVQAKKNDARVTRIGKFIRRFNIDELPQLLNVLRGEMSLVGPRPHALAHDQLFDQSIGLYARRHNVKPGITGWAQVNGHRGPFVEGQIQQRIAYDLYYIDNCSLLFDIQILWLTVTSKKAYRNAF